MAFRTQSLTENKFNDRDDVQCHESNVLVVQHRKAFLIYHLNAAEQIYRETFTCSLCAVSRRDEAVT